jgi:ABC-type uncharacterized transport system ATPase subunit
MPSELQSSPISCWKGRKSCVSVLHAPRRISKNERTPFSALNPVAMIAVDIASARAANKSTTVIYDSTHDSFVVLRRLVARTACEGVK